MKYGNNFFLGLLVAFLLSMSGGEAQAITITTPLDAMKASDSLYTDVMSQNLAPLSDTLESLASYVAGSDMGEEEKQNASERITELQLFLTSTSTGTTTTLTDFLRDANKLYASLTEYAYTKSEHTIPEGVYVMRSGARGMQIELLDSRLDRAENAKESIYDGWLKIRESVKDRDLQGSMDTTLKGLDRAFADEDTGGVYSWGVSVLETINLVEADYSKDHPLIDFGKLLTKKNALIGSVIVVLIGALGAFVVRRRRTQVIQG